VWEGHWGKWILRRKRVGFLRGERNKKCGQIDVIVPRRFARVYEGVGGFMTRTSLKKGMDFAIETRTRVSSFRRVDAQGGKEVN